MGGTGIALGTDGAAPFLNPANVTSVESALVLSVNFLALDFAHAKNWYVPGPVDTATYGNLPQSAADINRLSGNAIPSTFCLFQGMPRMNNHTSGRAGIEKFGYCFGTTELSQFDWSGKGYQGTLGDRSVTQASSVRRSWQRFVFAPTYAVNVTDRLTIGGSIQAVFDNFSFLNSVGTTTAGGVLPATSTAFESAAGGNSFALAGILGVTLTAGRWTLGGTVQSPDVVYTGHGNTSTYVQFANGTSTSSTYIGRGDFHAREPTRFGAGLGYKFPGGTTFELDTSFALADGDALDLDTQGTRLDVPGTANDAASVHLHTRFQPTFNAGLGAEIFFNPRYSILTGVGTDFSAVDHLDQYSLATSKIDRVFFSLGFGSHTPDGGTLLLGVQGYYGWGSALSPNAYATPPVLAPTSIETYGVLFVIGGTANVKAIEQAVNAMKSVVAPSAPPIHLGPKEDKGDTNAP